MLRRTAFSANISVHKKTLAEEDGKTRFSFQQGARREGSAETGSIMPFSLIRSVLQ
ncbi:hypothetical protein JJL56_32260 [Azospirillum sp. YIM DDC1]|uniref:Uncharacterized protein n=1 Tax=Azospirillum aestuarii TaxID=2802052 RepID=A0ABS1I9X7_9PROT|nr:hypothetical protein [Azospirillum aestuarii]MBK4723518.1 hypothetical protein [Azospirillum aestuarii]